MAILMAPERFRDFRIAELRWRLRRTERRQQLLLASLLPKEEERAQQQRRRRTYWLRPWLQRRVLLGQYHTLMNEIRMEDRGGFKSFLRLVSSSLLLLGSRCGWGSYLLRFGTGAFSFPLPLPLGGHLVHRKMFFKK